MQKSNLIIKIEIFCLILIDKSSEAELLNSILLETETDLDENYQNLFNILNNNENLEINNWITKKINSELIFLYSAMARIAELPLDKNFLEVDPLNMAIPIILNRSSPIDLRIKAANQSFINNDISVDSLAALYQSVDFNSKQLNNSQETIKELAGKNELLLSYYFQLVNIQIFPSERLEAVINFWNFAKSSDLDQIAYSLSYKIIDSIEITSEYLDYSPEIAISYIYNNDFEKALKWIDFYENTKSVDEKSTFVRILLNLHSSNEIESIIEVINSNFKELFSSINKQNEELIFVLFDILDENNKKQLNDNFENIYDIRLMPSIFILEKIQNAISNNNSNDLLIYTILSLNNKEWKDIHPEHLKIILSGYSAYKNGDLIKDIILEIFTNYKII